MKYTTLLLEISIKNKYTNWYCSIIDNAIERKLSNKSKANLVLGYTELHHIIPESFFILRSRKGPKGIIDGNSNDKNNKVYLTAKEHFLCHWLLTKMFDNTFFKIKAENAFIGFAFDNSGNRKLNSTQYSNIRKYKSKLSSEKNIKLLKEGNHQFQKDSHKHETSIRSTKRNIELMEKGEHPFQTENAKEKRKITRNVQIKKGTHIFQQPEIRKKAQMNNNIRVSKQVIEGTFILQQKDIREQNGIRVSNRNSEILICPHCSKSGLYLNMKKYHFDYCTKNVDCKRKIFECPHCETKSINKGNMTRYHFNNCKSIKL